MIAWFMSHFVVGLLLARAVAIPPKNGALHNSRESGFLTVSHLLVHFTLGNYRRAISVQAKIAQNSPPCECSLIVQTCSHLFLTRYMAILISWTDTH